ncbi:ABC transporter ATP-binding protein [Caldisalinibacter kiritimatiensis]|uniref:Ferric enterobactin transport ATP-binding protein fepC n=1 Tax=Caldisalinibacter kiritimatiensis TaxID=1304284 RepID=R1CN49_9FIRM|nr:ABC transporter ATP-binding protein [Caldisalinibacter kiritimatiensis]EOD00136.1 ferric enterobactin transport ATP-binding protein fepC [Caldisalinibacter kiritimatiensis]
MNAVKISNLCLGYGKKTVIRDFTIDIQKGQIVSIIGPNGSGKSTVLMSLAKLLNPQKGIVYIGKNNITRMSNKEVSRSVSILLQHNTYPSDISVRDLIYYGRLPHKKWYQSKDEEDQKVIAWVIENTNLQELQNKKINCLSGGERQRVWLAVALAQEPKVLLLDEPTTYLDISHQLELLELVKKLNQKSNMTVVMVLHDLNQAAKYSDRVIVLKKGQIVSDGAPKEILKKELIRKVYNVDSRIYYDEIDGHPIIIPNKNKLEGERI